MRNKILKSNSLFQIKKIMITVNNIRNHLLKLVPVRFSSGKTVLISKATARCMK